MYEEVLLNMDFIHLAQFLTKLPDNISAESLFRSVDRICMQIDNKRFTQALACHRESVTQQQSQESWSELSF